MALGAKLENIQSLKSFDLAYADVKQRKPEIIISEYAVEAKFSLDLQREQRKYLPKTNDRFFMLITGNSSESVVAEAAEEDVDCFLLKPFTNNQLIKYLINGFLNKMSPSEYQVLIEKGKEHLKKGRLEEAAESFISALKKTAKPCLAHYYLAKVVELKKDYKQAVKEYDSGLDLNSMHYKCLVGKYEALDTLKDIHQAYEIIQRVVSHFPISPQRLAKIFKLAVYTKNFQDIHEYYEIYKTLDRRSEELSKVVPAGLFVYSKFLLKKGDFDQAADALQKTALAAQLESTYMEKIIETLIAYKRYNDAEKMLKQFPQHQRESEIFKYLDFKVSVFSTNDNSVINYGRKLIKDGIKYPFVYEATIEKLYKTKKDNMAESVVYKAIEVFPDKRDHFAKMLKE